MILSDTSALEINVEERRQNGRVKLSLPGRCMLDGRHEFPCWTTDVSPSGVGIVGSPKGDIDQRVIAYIDKIGRVEGMIARRFDRGIGVRIQAPALKRERLARRIAWLVEHETLDAPDQRWKERVDADSRHAILRTADGREFAATLIDISTLGAALQVEAAPPVGTAVTIGKASARIVRHFAGGIAIVFGNQLPAEVLTDGAQF